MRRNTCSGDNIRAVVKDQEFGKRLQELERSADYARNTQALEQHVIDYLEGQTGDAFVFRQTRLGEQCVVRIPLPPAISSAFGGRRRVLCYIEERGKEIKGYLSLIGVGLNLGVLVKGEDGQARISP